MAMGPFMMFRKSVNFSNISSGKYSASINFCVITRLSDSLSANISKLFSDIKLLKTSVPITTAEGTDISTSLN